MTSIAERLGLTNVEREIKLGKSFTKGAKKKFHTFRYDFKPASVDATKMATVDIGEGHQVTVTVPHIDKGNGATHTVFKGCKKPYTKECVLIIDNMTGDITLEKLTYNVQLKKTRAEGSSKIKQSVLENNIMGNKKSHRSKLSPQPKSIWSSSHYSVPTCSPLPKSPNSHSSPPSRTSPPVPSLVVPAAAAPSSDLKHSTTVHDAAIPATSRADVDMDEPEIGVLSSSESSEEFSGSESSASESSDEDDDNHGAHAKVPVRHGNSNLNGNAGFSAKVHSSSQPGRSMPQISQLSEDLKLSSSESEVD